MELANVRLPLRVLADSRAWRLAQWLVQPGFPVYLKQRVAVLKSLTTGAVDHALAPHSGVLVKTSVSEGDVVDASNAPIAQIEYCPHSVVFKGVCAICGQDAETPHFAETPSTEESRLPVAYNSALLSVTRAEAESVSSTNARRLFESNRLSLVLDLDHTLVHATDDPRAAFMLKHSPQDADLSSVSSFTLQGPSSVTSTLMHIKLRPNLVQFLTRVAPKFELHIYTMGSRPYADRVAHLIDPDKTFFSGRITSREDFSEGLFNRKSIQRLFPCDDSMVLIVDDREDVWISGTDLTFMPNLIAANPYSFWGGLHEAYDRSSRPKQTVSPHVSADLQSTHPPTSVVLHANGNGQPLRDSNAISACTQQAGKENDKSDTKQPSLLPLDESRGRKIIPREHSEGLILDKVKKEAESPLSEGIAQVDHEKSAANEKPHAGIKNDDRSKFQQSLKTIAVGSQLQADSSANDSSPVAGKAHSTPDKLSERLCQTMKGWWDADKWSKSSNHLLRLAQILEDCHAEFFRRAKLALAGTGFHKSGSNDHFNKFQAPFDIKDIVAERRRQVLAGCVLTFTGVIPTGTTPDVIPIWNLALRLGAVCSMDFINGRTTHVVASLSRPTNTQKCKEAMHCGTAFIVFVNWLEDSALNFERQDELEYSEKRVREQYENAADFRKSVEERYKQAARVFKKRNKAELDDISAGETYLQTKKARTETKQSLDCSLDIQSTDQDLTDVRVLSGDEIGAAIDAAFEE